MATEIKKVVKEGYQEFYDKAMAQLEQVEEIAKAKVEEMIKDDKTRLQAIIDVCTEEVEVEVPEQVEETEITTEEVAGEYVGE